MKSTSPMILSPQQWTKLDRLKALAFGGRKRGTLGGSLASDLSALKKALILCGDCHGKFDWRRNGYYSVYRYDHNPAIGQCVICRAQIHGNDGRLFIHEVHRPQCYVTKDEHRSRGKTMARLAAAFSNPRRM